MAPGVHVATSATWATTTTVVDGPDGSCLLADPALAAGEIAALATWLAATGRTVSCAWATHAHWDHVLWHPALPDVPRWATARTAALAERERTSLVHEADATAPGHDRALLGRLRALEGDRLPWAGPDAVVVETDGHRAGHGSLLLPGPRVLVAVDMLSAREVPLLDLDRPGDAVTRYRGALDHLARTLPDVDVVVPGHGPVLDRDGALAVLGRDHAYLDALERGSEPVDDRLADPWVLAEHRRQLGVSRS